VYPIYILDPYFIQSDKVGPNRWKFLLESLEDLDCSLKKLNSRLLIIQGDPVQQILNKISEWKVDLICFECDTEPYSKDRDSKLVAAVVKFNLNVEIIQIASHTLYDLKEL